MSNAVGKFSIAVAAVAMLTGMATTSAAAAPDRAGSSAPAATASDIAGTNYLYWDRPCGTRCAGYVETGVAATGKGEDGSCAGHAWVRVKCKTGNWSSWKNGAGSAKIESPATHPRRAAQGCASCKTYTTTP